MREALRAREQPGARVIPLRADRSPAARALDRAVAAPAGRGRAVLLAVPPEADPSALLRDAGARGSDARRCVVVEAHRADADGLAARILAKHGAGAVREPRALLRAWLAHLASQGHELVIGLDDAGGLPLETAGWLGRLVRASRGSARLIVPWARDARIWRVLEELGLETEVVEPESAPTDASRSSAAAPPARPARSPGAPRAPRPTPARVWSRAIGAATLLAGCAVLAAVFWSQRPTPGPIPVASPIGPGPPEATRPVDATEPDAPTRLALTVRRETPPAPPAVRTPAPTRGTPSLEREVEQAIRTLLADDPGGRHAAALERLRALDPVAVAEEVVYQFDALTPVGPLAPAQVDRAWEALRTALCRSQLSGDERAGDERAALPPELGCRP